MAEKIIINLPTNIGDAILGLPVIRKMRSWYPDSTITVVASAKTKGFFLRNSCVDRVVLFDKRWKLSIKRKFAFSLRGKYDVAVDLKNSLLPYIIGARRKTGPLRFYKKGTHVRDRYLRLIKKFKREDNPVKCEILLSSKEKERWAKENITESVFICCSSRSDKKRYNPNYLKEVILKIKDRYPIVLLGEASDRDFYGDTLEQEGIIDLVGKTSISDVFYLLQNFGKLLISVDSSILHIGSYLNIPIVSLFGPTSPQIYGPYSDKSCVLTKEGLECRRCASGKCQNDIECMKIHPQKIIEAVIKII